MPKRAKTQFKSTANLRLRRPVRHPVEREPTEKTRDWLPLVLFQGIAPLVIGLVGGMLGAWATISTTATTIEAESSIAVAEFRRDQRQAKYDTILQNATGLDNATEFVDELIVGQAVLPELLSLCSPRGFCIPSHDPDGEETPQGAVARENMADWEKIRQNWQDAYTALDQAISNARIAGSNEVIGLASALRDKYRRIYFQRVHSGVDSVIKFHPSPDHYVTSGHAGQLAGFELDERNPPYDPLLLESTPEELTEAYIAAAEAEVDFNDG